jgi:hypothetical protein
MPLDTYDKLISGFDHFYMFSDDFSKWAKADQDKELIEKHKNDSEAHAELYLAFLKIENGRKNNAI